MPSRSSNLLNAVAVCVCVGTTLGAIGWHSTAQAEEPQHVIDLRTQSEAETRIHGELDSTTQVDFIDTPLSDVVLFLSDQHGIPVLLDEQSLLDDGLGTDEPITLQLEKVTLKSTLKIMLEPLGLTAVIEDEVMKITTQTKADEKVATHVYDVRALQKHQIDSDAIVELIPKVISPGSWSEDAGSIQALPGVVVVRNTARVQSEVKELFVQLERLGLSKAAVSKVSDQSTAPAKVATR